MKPLRLIALLLAMAVALIVAFIDAAAPNHWALFVALVAAFLASDGGHWIRGRRGGA